MGFPKRSWYTIHNHWDNFACSVTATLHVKTTNYLVIVVSSNNSNTQCVCKIVSSRIEQINLVDTDLSSNGKLRTNCEERCKVVGLSQQHQLQYYRLITTSVVNKYFQKINSGINLRIRPSALKPTHKLSWSDPLLLGNVAWPILAQHSDLVAASIPTKQLTIHCIHTCQRHSTQTVCVVLRMVYIIFIAGKKYTAASL